MLFRFTRLAGAAVLCAAALAGCASSGQTRAERDAARDIVLTRTPLDLHQPKVSRSSERLEMTVAPDAYELGPNERAALGDFARSYLQLGEGPLVLSLPAGQMNAQGAVQIAAQARAALFEAGVPWDRIVGGNYAGGNGAPIVFEFARYVVEKPDCPLLSSYDLRKSADNMPMQSFGCATQSNLAAMIANPADLVRPADMTQPDAGRRARQLGQYREGGNTAASRSGDERVTVSGGQ